MEHFPQSGVTDGVKMDFLLKIIQTSLQQLTSALISAGGYNYEKLRYFVDSQVAQNLKAESCDQGSKFDSKEPSGMIIGEVSTEQTTGNTQNFNAVSNSGAERDPLKDWNDDGNSEGLMEVECVGCEKAAGTSMGLATIAINMATLGATAQRCQSKKERGQ